MPFGGADKKEGALAHWVKVSAVLLVLTVYGVVGVDGVVGLVGVVGDVSVVVGPSATTTNSEAQKLPFSQCPLASSHSEGEYRRKGATRRNFG